MATVRQPRYAVFLWWLGQRVRSDRLGDWLLDLANKRARWEPYVVDVPVVEDGFGMVAEGCHDGRCDIQVVRPGKVQCSNYCGRET